MVVTVGTKDRSAWKNVKTISLDQTVKKSATVLAKAVTEQQEHVTLGVIRDGKAFIVTKLAIRRSMDKTAAYSAGIVLSQSNVITSMEHA